MTKLEEELKDKNFINFAWGEELQKIIDDYNESIDGKAEALDGDGVDDLVKIIKAKLNLMQGNITEEEYQEAF